MFSIPKYTALLASLLAAMALPAAALGQSISAEVGVELTLQGVDPMLTSKTDTLSSLGTVSVSDERTSSSGDASAFSTATAGVGTVKARITGQALQSEFYGVANSAHSWADISYTDSLIVQGPLTSGFLTAAFSLEYSWDTDVGGVLWGGSTLTGAPTTVRLALGTDERTYLLAFNRTVTDSTFESTIPPGVITLTTPVTFGAPVPLEMSLSMDAWAYGLELLGFDGSARFDLDFAKSLYWAGQVSVTDDLGNPVDFTLTSASGIDYTKSYVPTTVPDEVSTLWLLLAAATAIAASRRFTLGRSCGGA